MARENLGSILEWLHPGLGPPNDGYEVTDDGSSGGSYISSWDETIMGAPKPDESAIMLEEANWVAAMDAPENKIEFISLSKERKVLYAAIIRASSNWNSYPAAIRSKVQAILDEAATWIIGQIT